MNKINALTLIAIALSLSLFLAFGCSKLSPKKGAGENHETEHHDDEKSGEENVVTLDRGQISAAGIKTETATIVNIGIELQLTGEIGFDETRTAHIVPRVSGTMRKVRVNLGDAVRAGEALAVIESSELGEAKSDYLEKKQGLDQARFDMERTRTIRDNAVKMIDFLNTHPSLPELGKMGALDLGQNRQALVASYSDLVFARAAYQREKELYGKKISSGEEYQEAENNFKKAEAVFTAARDEISYEVERAFQEKKRAVRSAELALGAAERNLHLLGLDQYAIHAIAERNGNHESLALYTVTAPFSGTIVEKHAAVGEQVGEDRDLFTIADIETVWVIASVYEKDIASIREGQSATVTVKARPGRQFDGTVKWIGDTIEQRSRTLKIRIEVHNGGQLLKPGMFARIALKVGSGKKALVVPSSSIQQSKGENIVFVALGQGKFEKREVRTGMRSSSGVEILSGLRDGDRVVTSGNFILKSELEKAGVGDPHGH